MTELIGFLESWCDGEQVLEDGETFEEEKERQEIYTHHVAAQADLETVIEVAEAAAVEAGLIQSGKTLSLFFAGDIKGCIHLMTPSELGRKSP